MNVPLYICILVLDLDSSNGRLTTRGMPTTEATRSSRMDFLRQPSVESLRRTFLGPPASERRHTDHAHTMSPSSQPRRPSIEPFGMRASLDSDTGSMRETEPTSLRRRGDILPFSPLQPVHSSGAEPPSSSLFNRPADGNESITIPRVSSSMARPSRPLRRLSSFDSWDMSSDSESDEHEPFRQAVRDSAPRAGVCVVCFRTCNSSSSAVFRCSQ